jgi:hypothetical protein
MICETNSEHVGGVAVATILFVANVTVRALFASRLRSSRSVIGSESEERMESIIEVCLSDAESAVQVTPLSRAILNSILISAC